MDLSLWHWLAAAVVAVFSIIAVKIAFTFDLNRHLEGRREREKERLKALCPHTELTFFKSGEVRIESRFYKPAMTLNCVCRQCGLVVPDEQSATRIAQGWLSNHDEWEKADKRFRKAHDKFYGI